MNFFSIARFLGVGAVAALFLGASLAVSPANAGIVVLHPGQAMVPDVSGGCVAHGGVRVDPCRIHFNASNPGPDMVTVRTPGGGGTLTETDNCASTGVATVTSQGSDQYLVTAGATQGVCFAHFDFYNTHGKKIGGAVLGIVNRL